eukprot:5787585-Alexandrium_andersonii.AAC.1
MSASLVGSEMCIRDRRCPRQLSFVCGRPRRRRVTCQAVSRGRPARLSCCLLYTSDAADDM